MRAWLVVLAMLAGAGCAGQRSRDAGAASSRPQVPAVMGEGSVSPDGTALALVGEDLPSKGLVILILSAIDGRAIVYTKPQPGAPALDIFLPTWGPGNSYVAWVGDKRHPALRWSPSADGPASILDLRHFGEPPIWRTALDPLLHYALITALSPRTAEDPQGEERVVAVPLAAGGKEVVLRRSRAGQAAVASLAAVKDPERAGRSLALVVEWSRGKSDSDRRANLLAIDCQTAELRWDTPMPLEQDVLETATEVDAGRALLVTSTHSVAKAPVERADLWLLHTDTGRVERLLETTNPPGFCTVLKTNRGRWTFLGAGSDVWEVDWEHGRPVRTRTVLRGGSSLPIGARADAKGNVEFFSAGDGVVWRAWLDSGLVSELAGTAYEGAGVPRVVG